MADGAVEALIGNYNACWKCPNKNLKMKIKNKNNNNEITLDATNIEESSDATVRTIVSFLIKSMPVLREIAASKNTTEQNVTTETAKSNNYHSKITVNSLKNNKEYLDPNYSKQSNVVATNEKENKNKINNLIDRNYLIHSSSNNTEQTVTPKYSMLKNEVKELKNMKNKIEQKPLSSISNIINEDNFDRSLTRYL